MCSFYYLKIYFLLYFYEAPQRSTNIQQVTDNHDRGRLSDYDFMHNLNSRIDNINKNRANGRNIPRTATSDRAEAAIPLFPAIFSSISFQHPMRSRCTGYTFPKISVLLSSRPSLKVLLLDLLSTVSLTLPNSSIVILRP